jgi:hypothetical protein
MATDVSDMLGISTITVHSTVDKQRCNHLHATQVGETVSIVINNFDELETASISMSRADWDNLVGFLA